MTLIFGPEKVPKMALFRGQNVARNGQTWRVRGRQNGLFGIWGFAAGGCGVFRELKNLNVAVKLKVWFWWNLPVAAKALGGGFSFSFVGKAMDPGSKIDPSRVDFVSRSGPAILTLDRLTTIDFWPVLEHFGGLAEQGQKWSKTGQKSIAVSRLRAILAGWGPGHFALSSRNRAKCLADADSGQVRPWRALEGAPGRGGPTAGA